MPDIADVTALKRAIDAFHKKYGLAPTVQVVAAALVALSR